MARTFSLPRPLLPTPPHRDTLELLDMPDIVPAATLAHNLRDIRRVNRFAGGTAVVLHHLPALLENVPRETPLTIVDIATGAADIPLALAEWGKKEGYDLRITATDVSDDVLAIARGVTSATPQILLEACDARALPYRDGAFDVALCSLALHHFPREEAVQVLREMGRVARRGIVVNDLVRTWPGYVGAWLLGNATTRNHLTRHDAPLSILRAWTPDELRAMAHEAGLRDARVATHAFWRMALVARGPG